MTTLASQSALIQQCLDRLQAGDQSAQEELIQCAFGRLERLTRKMLHGWERVHRWEQTPDVMQNSLMRLCRSLCEAKPARVVDFFRLAALDIRRELHDLAKHYYGPRGLGANHATPAWKPLDDRSAGPLGWASCGIVEDPVELAAWTEFHAQVEQLPDEEREMFDLLWYQGISQGEAAELLGISARTAKRRWASARLRLYKVLGGALPGCGDDCAEAPSANGFASLQP